MIFIQFFYSFKSLFIFFVVQERFHLLDCLFSLHLILPGQLRFEPIDEPVYAKITTIQMVGSGTRPHHSISLNQNSQSSFDLTVSTTRAD